MSDDKKKEDFLNILREAKEEMTRAAKARNDIVETLAYLKEKSGERFNFSVKNGSDTLEIMTNVYLKEDVNTFNLRLAVDAQGNVLGNMPDTETMHRREEAFLASLNEQLEQIETQVSRQLDAEGVTDEQARADRIKQIKANHVSQARYQKGTRGTNVLKLTDAETILTEIARNATLSGFISVDDIAADEAAGTAPKTVVNGIHMANREMEMALEKAQPLFDGLSHLKAISDGLVGFSATREKGSSNVNIIVSFNGPRMQNFFLKVDASGGVEFSETTEVVKADMTATDVLTAIAKEAALTLLLPNTTGTEAGDLLLTVAQGEEGPETEADVHKAIRAGVMLAAKDVAMAQLAAGNVEAELEFLKGQLKDSFNVKKHVLNGEVLLSINPQTNASMQIRFNAAGTMKVSSDNTAYNAWKEADVTKVVSDITKKAVQHALRQKPEL